MLVISLGYKCKNKQKMGFSSELVVENLPANAGDRFQSLVLEDPTCRRTTGPVCRSC